MSNQLDFFTCRETLSVDTLDRERIEVELGVIEAETWPARHRIHKYWGRKPSNVVKAYIELFTSMGDVVLDPFCGSSVVPIEAALLGRRAVGVDNNPIAVELGQALASPVSPKHFKVIADKIVRDTELLLGHLYRTECRNCGASCEVRSFGYDASMLVEVRYRCESCRAQRADVPTAEDLQLSEVQTNVPYETPDDNIYFGWEMQKLRRAGVSRWSELFTSRNLAISTFLIGRIGEVNDTDTRRWLRITFSSALAQFSRMIADFSGRAGGPSWKLNCYWMPVKWQELNPLRYFMNRVRKSLSALRELSQWTNGWGDRAHILLGDSRKLYIGDHSVDYIFTDPPYGGEGIQYGELSMLWGVWLGHPARLETEVAFNPYREFDQQHYTEGLAAIFRESARVLKPGKWMTVTFANKDPEVWDSLMTACRDAGFTLVTAAPMKRSAPALTETTMRRAPKADLLLTFQLAAGKPIARVDEDYPLRLRVNQIWTRLKRSKPSASIHDLFDRVTVDWFSWFYENGERPASVQPTLDMVEKFVGHRRHVQTSRHSESETPFSK